MNPKKKRKYVYLLKSLFTRKYDLAPAATPIDIVIPVIEKDLKILPYCLEGIRNCVTSPIKSYYIVAPETPAIRDFCKRHSLQLVPEQSVLGFSVKDIRYAPNGTDRSGWIFQQMLKMAGTIGTCDHFLVVDADHILLRPHTFLTADGQTVFYQSREYHQPYYDTLFAMTSHRFTDSLSYVDHKMLFSKQQLQRVKDTIEQHCGTPWTQAIIDRLNPDELSCFSEYETYGSLFPNEYKKVLPWRNKSLTVSHLADYDELVKRYAGRYLAITFPDYKKD